MRIAHLDPGTHTVSHDGKTYTVKDGMFDLPDALAETLLHFPGWVREHERPEPPDEEPTPPRRGRPPRR